MTDLARTLQTLEAAVQRKRYGGGILFFEPYPKQKKFLDLGAAKRERLLIAGNQNGKSITAAFETACHLTGMYPDWWQGKRFAKPTRGWICGESSVAVRDICQTKLCGAPGVESAYGSGMIPKDRLLDKSLGHGVTDAYDTIQVKHISGVSTATFKSYEQGRTKFQGESLDWIWFDEEPPLEIYSEGLTRTMATGGVVFTTFTPLLGPTAVVNRFLSEKEDSRVYVNMTIDDAEHIPEAQKKIIIASWPAHQREARARGVPMLGEGAIFTTAEEQISEERMRDNVIPPWWTKIWGIDIGIGHPFAAVLLLWDRDTDTIHIHHTIRMSDALPIMHAAAMRPVGINVPVAWPKDAGDREHGSGIPIRKYYRDAGLEMLGEPASHGVGFGGHQASTEAGIMEWDQRERTGRLKCAAHLADWFEERRLYHRKNGQIVKVRDDLMSATRIGLMMKRHARAVQLGGTADRERYESTSRYARGTPMNRPFDLFTGA